MEGFMAGFLWVLGITADIVIVGYAVTVFIEKYKEISNP